MATKKKKKRRNRFLGRALLIVVITALTGLVVIQATSFFKSNATTAIARASALGNYYNGTLVIVRNETLTEAENMTRIDFVANEGSRVSKSDVICKVYSSGYNQTEITRLQTYRDEIEAYHTNQVLSTYVDAELDNENTEIASLAQQVRTLVQGRGAGSLSNLERQIESALTVRKNYLRQKYPDDQTLSELYKMESDQLKKIESWTTTFTAKEDCLISFYTDGYENVLNKENYTKLDHKAIQAIIRGDSLQQVSNGKEPVFRTVMEDEWHGLFLCSDRDWNPVKGESYLMQLSSFENYVVEAKVDSFNRVGDNLLIRLTVEDSVLPVLNIRTCNATVGDFVSGVHVPVGALYTLDQTIGVVVLDGGVQTFVPVTVISYPDSNTAFVRPTMAGSPLEADKTVMLW